MSIRNLLLTLLHSLLLLVGCDASEKSHSTLPKTHVTTTFPSNDWLLAALQEKPLVAVGDVHGSEHVVGYLLTALQDDEIAEKIDDIAVEWGNSQYQQLADRYLLKGETIDLAELRPIWRNTLYFMAWQYQVYEEFFVGLKKLNEQREHKIRLVLAEPEFDWQQLSSQQWQQLTFEREQAYAARIQQEILDKQRRGLLLFGAFHTLKQPVRLADRKEIFKSLVVHLGAEQVFVVVPHMDDSTPFAEPQMRLLAADAWGQQPLHHYLKRLKPKPEMQLADIADGYLYLGPELRNARVASAAIADKTWHQQMWLRGGITGGRVQQQVGQWLQHYSHD